MIQQIKIVLALTLFVAQPQMVISQELEIKDFSPQAYAHYRVVEVWGEEQFSYFDTLVMKESKWVPTAQNPKSTAYGIPQFLDSTWATVGCEKTDDPHVQIDCMIDYVSERYDTPENAVEFHTKNNYY